MILPPQVQGRGGNKRATRGIVCSLHKTCFARAENVWRHVGVPYYLVDKPSVYAFDMEREAAHGRGKSSCDRRPPSITHRLHLVIPFPLQPLAAF